MEELWEHGQSRASLPKGTVLGVVGTLFLLFLGLGSAVASAEPPAVDQYTEQIPSPVGERPAGSQGRGRSEGFIPLQQADLLALGEEGGRAARVLASPDLNIQIAKSGDRADQGEPGSPITAIFRELPSGRSSTGFLLPLSMLAIVLLAFLAYRTTRPGRSR